MPEPITVTSLAVVLGIHALKGVFSNKDWGFDSIESSVASGALGLLDKILGKAISRREFKKQLQNAGEDARDWLNTERRFEEIWPVIESVSAQDWPELAAAVGDLRGDLSGTHLRAVLRRIFSIAQVDESLQDEAAEAFYEALLRALLTVPPLSPLVQRLLLDLKNARLRRILGENRTFLEDRFRALLDPKRLITWPYSELPLRDDRLSDLLIAKYRVVPFFGRTEEIDDLLRWCRKGDGIEARLYLGAGGEGKTHLFAHACSLMMDNNKERWLAGWLTLKRCCSEPGRLDELLDFDGGLLLGIDYAGSEVSDVITVVNQMLSGAPRAKIRLVLLERTSGYWWETLRSECALFAHTEVIQLKPLGDECDRRNIFDNAFASFRAIMPQTVDEPTDVDLNREEFANVLFIMTAAALAAAGDPSPTAAGVLDCLLNHETKWRERRARSLKLAIDGERLVLAAALGTLVDGCFNKSQAFKLLQRTPDFKDEKEIDLEKTCRTIGGSMGREGSFLPALKPDRLGERMLENILTDDISNAKKILSAVFQDKSDVFTHPGFMVLDRMSKRDPQGQWLHNLATTDLVFKLPKYSTSLMDFSALLTKRAVEVYPLKVEDLIEAKKFRGVLINNLAKRLSDLGRREEALDAAQEAVEIYRELSDARPDAFRPNLAASLNNVANRLSDLGRHEEALEAAQEAVGIRRELVDARPDAFRPDLAMSLGALGQVYVSLENHMASVKCFHEGLDTILPFLNRLPIAYAELTTALANDYIEACARAEIIPDKKLLVEVRRILDNMS